MENSGFQMHIRSQDIHWTEEISGSKLKMVGEFTVGDKRYEVTVHYESPQGLQEGNDFEKQIEKIRGCVKNSLTGQANELAKLAGYTVSKPLNGDRLVLLKEGKEASNHHLQETLEKVKPMFEEIFSQELSIDRTKEHVELSFEEVRPNQMEPESYRLDSVCQKIINAVEGKSPQRAIQVVEELCKSKDPRFNLTITGHGKFTFDKEAVLIQLGKMAPTQKEEISNKQKPIGKKEKEHVAIQLVGLVERKDVRHSFSIDNREKKATVVQKSGHSVSDSEGRVSLSQKKSSISAEIPKHERAVQGLANTASVQMGSQVICFRSAKTHKVHLQEERSKSDIAMRLEAGGKELKELDTGKSLNGLKKNEDGSYSYQPVIFTMMDSSLLKAVGTSLPGIVKRIMKRTASVPIENERKFLQKMVQSNEKRFKSKVYIEHTIKLQNGEEIKVQEYPAIVQNHVFSSQSEDKGNRSNARAGNISGQIQMLELMKSKNPNMFGEDFTELLKSKNVDQISQKIQNAFENETDPTVRMVLKAFHANLTGKSIDGKYSYDEPDSGGDLAMLTGIQADYLGLSFSLQCKSGNDRTMTAAAHKIAQAAFKELNGGYYDPETGDNKEAYKKFYTEALIHFGFSNVEASRGPVNDKGQSGLKIAKSPAAKKYMNLEEVEKHGELL